LRFRLIAPIAAALALAVAGVAYGASTTSHVVVKPPVKITVTLREYSFTFSRKSVPKGTTVIFTVVNKGTIGHNMDLVGTGKRTAILQPGHSAKLTVKFPKKATIEVVCDVPRHIQLGMVSSFKVIA
jgi:uncharacterized cupredoxin-like copper-binding protein